MAKYFVVLDSGDKRDLLKKIPKAWTVTIGMRVLLLPEDELGVNIKSMRPKWPEPVFINGDTVHTVEALRGQRVFVVANEGPEGELFAFRVQQAIGSKVRRVTLTSKDPVEVKAAFKAARKVNVPMAQGQLARMVINRLLAFKVQPAIDEVLGERVPLTRPLLAVLSVLVARKVARREQVEHKYIIRATMADGTVIDSSPVIHAVAKRMSAALAEGQYKVRKRRKKVQAEQLGALTVTEFFVQMASKGIDPSVAYGALLSLYEGGYINHPTTGDTILRRKAHWKLPRGAKKGTYSYTLFGWLSWRMDHEGTRGAVRKVTRYDWIWKGNLSRVILSHDAVDLDAEGWDSTEEDVILEVKHPKSKVVSAEFIDHFDRPEEHDVGSLARALVATGVRRISDLTEGLQQALDLGLVEHTDEGRYRLHQRGDVVVALVNDLFGFALDPDHIAREERRLLAIEKGVFDARAYLRQLYRTTITPRIVEERTPTMPVCHHRPMVLHFNRKGSLPHLECGVCGTIAPLDVVSGTIRPYSAPTIPGRCFKCNSNSLREGIRPTGRYIYCSACWADQPA